LAHFELFSKRQRRSRSEMPDVYQYELLPPEFRVQVIHILTDLFGEAGGYSQTEPAFKCVHDTLCREFGLIKLSRKFEYEGISSASVFDFLMGAPTDKALDLIEVAFRVGSHASSDPRFVQWSKPKITASEAVEELNARFLDHGIGFQFESGEILRVDSKILHAEVVKPALSLLSDDDYAGANSEYLNAHDHYRHGRHSECMNECLKTLESTLKIICSKREKTFRDTDTVKALIDIVFEDGLVPNWLQNQFAALRSTLESGVPTARNRVSAHGQGAIQREVPPHLASYVLNLTGSVIVFLVDSQEAYPHKEI
jgi:hypothetical protein